MVGFTTFPLVVLAFGKDGKTLVANLDQLDRQWDIANVHDARRAADEVYMVLAVTQPLDELVVGVWQTNVEVESNKFGVDDPYIEDAKYMRGTPRILSA